MNTFLAEAIGTMLLVLLGDGVVANVLLARSKGQNCWLDRHHVGWGVAVAIGVYAVGRISGAHLNPAVTVGLAAIGSFPWADVPGYVAAQMVGAFVGAVLVWIDVPAALGAHRRTPRLKLGGLLHGTAVGTPVANVMTEMIGTAVLLFGILAIAANAQAFTRPARSICLSSSAADCSRSSSACSSWASALSLGGPTGYAINPARDLGPRLAHAVLPDCWQGQIRIGATPGSRWSGPIIGGVLGALMFRAVGF